MKKFYQLTHRKFSLFLLGLFLFLSSSHAQVPVSADPGVGSFDITTMAGVPVNANALVKNIVYKLKLFILNGGPGKCSATQYCGDQNRAWQQNDTEPQF